MKPPPSILTNLEKYSTQQQHVPNDGLHICAHYSSIPPSNPGKSTPNTIVVYQAFSKEISSYAVSHQQFLGCPQYLPTRMTWIKPNFMWMMYRCGWCTKDINQARVLAIHITVDGFDEILKRAVDSRSGGTKKTDEVRLQWDPDHEPNGAKMNRRAIQLGLRGDALNKFHSEWIVMIEDVTDDLVLPQRSLALKHCDKESWDNLMVPVERVYIPSDRETCAKIGLSIDFENFEKKK